MHVPGSDICGHVVVAQSGLHVHEHANKSQVMWTHLRTVMQMHDHVRWLMAHVCLLLVNRMFTMECSLSVILLLDSES